LKHELLFIRIIIRRIDIFTNYFNGVHRLMNRIKHIIWDWNGTLFDDVELCLEIINGILSRRNLGLLSLKDYRSIFTFPVKDYYEIAGLDFNKYSFEDLGREWMEEYELRKGECCLHKGAAGIIEKISGKGIGQSILSAYSQQSLEQIISRFGLRKYFTHMNGLDHIYATSKIENGKQLIKKLGSRGAENLFIGDTVHDYEVSKEIGASCILIADGHQGKKKLETCGVDVYDSLKGIPFDEIL
jgi:phosphoglycolate phosphatase